LLLEYAKPDGGNLSTSWESRKSKSLIAWMLRISFRQAPEAESRGRRTLRPASFLA